MDKIFIFAGTKDGKVLAEWLSQKEKEVHIFVATEYGEEVLPKEASFHVHQGRMTVFEMKTYFEKERPDIVVDATHPYAVEVSMNLKESCESTKVPYLRLLREKNPENSACIYVDSKEEAVEYLNETTGKVLFTTGSKDLKFYTEHMNDTSRMYVRILADAKTVAECREMGYSGKQIICMQGPFSSELNAAMLKQVNAKYLLTKDTGTTGGFAEKLEGARLAGVKVIVIRRPVEETGLSIEEMKKYFDIGINYKSSADQVCVKRKLQLVGIGMGSEGEMTRRAYEVCQNADVILGAKRMIQSLEFFHKPMEGIYQPREIEAFLEAHPEYENVVIAFSGDVGFYSGAGAVLDYFNKYEYDVELICGVSSPVYAASRFGMPWQDMKLMSMHGRKQNIISAVRTNKKVFTLVDSREGVRDLAKILTDYGYDHVRMYVGNQLSYPEEYLMTGTPEELLQYDLNGLSVIIIENASAEEAVITHGLPDDAFIRGKAPMTKEEIRSISLSKLALTKSSIVYDIGAGTGSIAVECALQVTEGTVYAVEKKADALGLLEQNKRAFGADNLKIAAGEAPDVLEMLPVPTHAFIGGSSGNMDAIIQRLIDKNPNVRIVINAIAMETVVEVMQIIKKGKFAITDIVQVSVGKSREMADYHMMIGQNPVYIFTLQKEL